MGKPFSFTIKFEGELDGVPGNLYSEADHQNYVIRHYIDMFKTYNPQVTVIETTDARGVFGGWNSMHEGWIDVEGFTRPAHLSDDVEVQVRTASHRYGWPEWLKPSEIWVPERTHERDRVTAYRFRPTLRAICGDRLTLPFEVGKHYLTLGGKTVTAVEEVLSCMWMVFDDGVKRTNFVEPDVSYNQYRGRTAHADPGNFFPDFVIPDFAPQPATADARPSKP